MAHYEKISGERIYLSPIDKDDMPRYTKWVNDAHITDRIGISHLVFTEEKEQQALEDLAKDGYNFAIIRRDSDGVIGNCSLQQINHVYRCAECGLIIGHEKNRGKGYGSEALRLLLGYGFNTLNLNNIMLKVFSFNKNAIACYEKLGFKLIGARRQGCFINGQYYDELYMDILSEDFRAKG